jgi:RimJ/RimL family protein N-acetyltransferase
MKPTLRRLTMDDAPALQRLFDRSAEFFALIEESFNANEELAACAPGHTADDTFSFGAFRGEQLVGYCQLWRDYPHPREWCFVLILVDPAARGGLGIELHRAMCDFAIGQGAAKLWGGVLAKNEGAHRLWLRLGWVETERRPHRTGEVILLSLPLT